MKKIIYYFSLLLIFFNLAVFTGCSKEKKYKTSVSGHVKEKNGNRKIAGAKVYLTELKSYTYNTVATFVDSAITDNNGYYKMTTSLPGDDYVIFASAKKYYSQNDRYNDVENLQDIKPGKDQVCNVELWPQAWLKIRFINQSGANFVNVNRTYGGSDIYVDEPDVTVFALVKGNDTTRLAYFVYPGGEPRSHFIYCPGLDTTYTEIFY